MPSSSAPTAAAISANQLAEFELRPQFTLSKLRDVSIFCTRSLFTSVGISARRAKTAYRSSFALDLLVGPWSEGPCVLQI